MSTGVIGDSEVVARKSHTCGLCLRRIEVGVRHRRYTFASDGEISTNREHINCAELFYSEWWDGDPYDSPDPQELYAELVSRGMAQP